MTKETIATENNSVTTTKAISDEEFKVILARASKLGVKELPQENNEFREKIVILLEKFSPEYFTAQRLKKSFAVTDSKVFSDNLWHLEKAGKIEKGSRGYYRALSSK